MCNRFATASTSDREARVVPCQSRAPETTAGFASELAAETSRGDRRDTDVRIFCVAGGDAIGDRSPPLSNSVEH